MPAQSSSAAYAVEPGSFLRRKADGKAFEVIYISPGRNGDVDRVQLKPAEAKNLKNTRWIGIDNLPDRYDAADAPLPPTLAERIMAEIGIPTGAHATASVSINFPLDNRQGEWGPAAVDFVRRYGADAWWKWMDVPSNAERNKQDGWWALDLYATADGVSLYMSGPGGWTTAEGQALTVSLKAAKADATPPPPEPDHRCPRCSFGWSAA